MNIKLFLNDLRQSSPRVKTAIALILILWAVTLVAAILLVGATIARAGGDPLALARIGTRFSDLDPAGTEGYDKIS